MGKPLPDARPEMQKSGRKSRAKGEDEAGSRGEREQQPIRRKEKLRRQGSESQSQRAEGPVAVSQLEAEVPVLHCPKVDSKKRSKHIEAA